MIRLMQDLMHWILYIYNYINVFASIFVTFLLTSSYLLYFTPLIICLRTMADGYFFFFLICGELEADGYYYFFLICAIRAIDVIFCGSSVSRELDVNVNTFSWLESCVVNLELDRYSLCQPPKINLGYFILILHFQN